MPPRGRLTRTKGNKGNLPESIENIRYHELEAVMLESALSMVGGGTTNTPHNVTDGKTSGTSSQGNLGRFGLSANAARAVGAAVRRLLADQETLRRECRANAVTAVGTRSVQLSTEQRQASEMHMNAKHNYPTDPTGGTKPKRLSLGLSSSTAHDDEQEVFSARKVQRMIGEQMADLAKTLAAADGGAKEKSKGDSAHENGIGVPYTISVHDEKGARNYMEDKFTVCSYLNELCGHEDVAPTLFIGVYDGHTGKLAAEYTRTHLHVNIARDPLYKTDLAAAVTNAYKVTDERFNEIARRDGLKDGTTCVTLLIREGQLYVHWCGDSEAVLCQGDGDVLPLVTTHSPARPDEKQRIQEAGGTVVWFGTWRVNGTLGVARSIGDVPQDGIVIPDPDHVKRPLSPSQHFVLLATDGLFDVMTHEEAANLALWWAQTSVDGAECERSRDDVARLLVGEALRRKTKDNVTAIVLYFDENQLPERVPAWPEHPMLPRRTPPMPSLESAERARAKGDQ